MPCSKNIWMWVQCKSVKTFINNAQDRNAFTCWSTPPPLPWISTGSSVLRSQWNEIEVVFKSSGELWEKTAWTDAFVWMISRWCDSFFLSPKVHQSLIIDTKYAVTTTRQRSWYWINSVHEMVFAVKIRVNPLKHTRLHFLTFTRSSKKQIYVAKTHQELSTAENVSLCVSKKWSLNNSQILLHSWPWNYKKSTRFIWYMLWFISVHILSRWRLLCCHQTVDVMSSLFTAGSKHSLSSHLVVKIKLCLNMPDQHRSTAAFFKPLQS